MLIKKKLKNKEFHPCSIISKLKKQSLPLYPIYKKQNKYKLVLPQCTLDLFPKIEQRLLKSLAYPFNSKRIFTCQKEKKTLSYLYPSSVFNFQREAYFSQRFSTNIFPFSLIHSKEGNNRFTTLKKNAPCSPQLKIVLKSYNSQLQDIRTSITAISKLINYLNSCNIKQFKKFLVNSFYLTSFGLYSSFFSRLIKEKNLSNSNYFCSGISNTFCLMGNSINTSPFSPLSKDKEKLQTKQKTKVTQMPTSLHLLIKQPLIQRLEKICKVIKKQKQPIYTFSALQKTNYCNRYFFKSAADLKNGGPINKQVQKTIHSSQLFTVIRSPFVFKKTREQFIKQQLSYSIKIELHSPTQKELFIQSLSLLRLPVELEIHC